MLAKRLVGLKVITVFTHRGAKVYIRARDRWYEQLIIYKDNLFTHYFEAPPETGGRKLYQEEEMSMISTVTEIARATVDEIINQRSPIQKLKNYVQSKAADLHAEWRKQIGKSEQAEAQVPAIEVPQQASSDETEKQ